MLAFRCPDALITIANIILVPVKGKFNRERIFNHVLVGFEPGASSPKSNTLATQSLDLSSYVEMCACSCHVSVEPSYLHGRSTEVCSVSYGWIKAVRGILPGNKCGVEV